MFVKQKEFINIILSHTSRSNFNLSFLKNL